jgi:hypothetical protein
LQDPPLNSAYKSLGRLTCVECSDKLVSRTASVCSEIAPDWLDKAEAVDFYLDKMKMLMGETGRLQDWKVCCYYHCYRKERKMERCGSSQGLDIWVALPADLRWWAAPHGAASAPRGAVSAGGAGGTQQMHFPWFNVLHVLLPCRLLNSFLTQTPGTGCLPSRTCSIC